MTRHLDRPFPILIGSQRIYDGRVVNLRVDTIEVSSGRNVRREVVEHPGAVVVLPLDGEGRIMWVRQYRYAIDEDLLELPAGTLEENEGPEVCAAREVAEETGFAPGRLEPLGRFYSAPGFCTEYMYAYLASELQPASEAHADEDEDIEVVPLAVDDSVARVLSGEIQDAKSIAALFLYLQRRA